MHTRVDFKNTELNECQNTKKTTCCKILFIGNSGKGKIIDTLTKGSKETIKCKGQKKRQRMRELFSSLAVTVVPRCIKLQKLLKWST